MNTYTRIAGSAVCLCLGLITGCTGEEPESDSQQQVPLVRPAKIATAVAAQTTATRRFAAVVGAAHSTELAFRVSGQLNELNVIDGQKVTKGALVARLDDTDFRIQLDDAKAKHRLAESQYHRIRKLAEEGLAPASELDLRLADMLIAKANLEKAQQSLKYTHLYAPFDGTVAQSHAEVHDHLSATQPVVTFQNQSAHDVSFELPESLIKNLDPARLFELRATVVFDAYSDSPVRARFKEMRKQSETGALSYRVTFSVSPEDKMRILPGMSAELTINLGNPETEADQSIMVPTASLFSLESDELENNHSYLWIVGDDNRTELRKVEVARLTAGGAIVLSGVNKGERVLAAAPSRMSEGQEVRPLVKERGL